MPTDNELVFGPNDPVPIAIFATKLKPPRTADCLRKWHRKGVLNRLADRIVKCELSRLTNGGLAISQAQYDAFIAKLNEKP